MCWGKSVYIYMYIMSIYQRGFAVYRGDIENVRVTIIRFIRLGG